MNKPLFKGVCTALVTPFFNNSINYPMVQQLLRRQINAGVSAVVLGGTTGESATLSDFEKIELYRIGKEFVQDRCMIIGGTGSNSTAHAVELSIQAEAVGCDALLVVSPYYNKATEEGLYAHYLSIAHAVSIPIIMYNVPSRTGVDIPVSVYQRLCRVPNITGVKEASTDLTKITKIKNACGTDFSVWSGNDDLITPVLSMGGSGVISVLSNIYPHDVKLLCDAALDGDFDTASSIQCHFQPLIEALFQEVNPIPVKEAMKKIGYDCGKCRLPLCAPSNKTSETLNRLLSE